MKFDRNLAVADGARTVDQSGRKSITAGNGFVRPGVAFGFGANGKGNGKGSNGNADMGQYYQQEQSKDYKQDISYIDLDETVASVELHEGVGERSGRFQKEKPLKHLGNKQKQAALGVRKQKYEHDEIDPDRMMPMSPRDLHSPRDKPRGLNAMEKRME